MNNVVVGPLEDLVGYDDCYRSIAGSYVLIPTISLNIGDTVVFDINESGGAGFTYIADSELNRGVIALDGDSEWFNAIGFNTLPEYHGAGVYTATATSNIDITTLFARYSLVDSWVGCVNKLEIFKDGQLEASYVKNGDFGSSTLIDHSGNGNDGTIHGATWWKSKDNVPVDGNFPDKESWRTTWDLPLSPTVVTGVIGQDLPPTGDPFYLDQPITVIQQEHEQVIVGPLSELVGYDDCLKFSKNSAEGVITPLSPSPDLDGCDINIEFTMYRTSDNTYNYLVDWSPSSSRGVILRINNTDEQRLSFYVYNSGGGATVVHTEKLTVGLKYDIRCTISPTLITCTVNNTLYSTPMGGLAPSPDSHSFTVGCSSELGDVGYFDIHSFSIGGIEYDIVGQFGNVGLVDNNGGNSCDIRSTQWWKSKDNVPVSGNFPDKESWRNTWNLPLSPTVVTGVIGQELPPTGDPFYLDQPITVIQQTEAILAILIEEVTSMSANPRKIIKGTDISTHDFTTKTPTLIFVPEAESAGILKLKLYDDDAFSDMPLEPLGVWQRVGLIKAIDPTSTLNLDACLLGVE